MSETIKDQPPPEPNGSRPVWELVVEDMRERDRVGRERYGVPLQANNGRDALVDGYQECLDMAVYLRQAIEERVRPATAPDRPKIVCLVGSSRFKGRFHLEAERLEKSGVLALMMGFFQHADVRPVSDAEREVLERVDRLRIDLADEVLVVNLKQPRCAGCKAWFSHATNGTVWATCRCGGDPYGAPREDTPYVGESTRKEIDYALSVGKPVRYLEE